MVGENNDITTADLDLDGLAEVICYAQNADTIRYNRIDQSNTWNYFDVATNVNDLDVHAGFAPHGIGDLNGDQYPDILMPFYWYENPGGDPSGPWMEHTWNYREIEKTPYGRSFRSWITDLDSDSFTEHMLPLPAGNTGSFHSLIVVDFDLDGDLDIFLGEQEDNNQRPARGMKPEGLKERGIFLVNEGSAKAPRFEIKIIQEDNPGWHYTQASDVDGDGDLDLVTKIWNADESGIWQPDFWRNDWLEG